MRAFVQLKNIFSFWAPTWFSLLRLSYSLYLLFLRQFVLQVFWLTHPATSIHWCLYDTTSLSRVMVGVQVSVRMHRPPGHVIFVRYLLVFSLVPQERFKKRSLLLSSFSTLNWILLLSELRRTINISSPGIDS